MSWNAAAFRAQLHKLQQIIRFGQASALSAVFSLGLPVALVEFVQVDADIAAAIGLATAYLVNFLSLRFYVFRSDSEIAGQIVFYILSSLMFRIAEYGIFYALHNVLYVHYAAALSLVLLVSMILKYFVLGKFVFKRRKPA